MVWNLAQNGGGELLKSLGAEGRGEIMNLKISVGRLATTKLTAVISVRALALMLVVTVLTLVSGWFMSGSAGTEKPSEITLRLQHVFLVPRDRVFHAWVDQEAVKKGQPFSLIQI